ncbi:MAG: OmpA family protein [Calditrichaeota bacterium]|nr:OmpA family protein [Calditrichota bacterium]
MGKNKKKGGSDEGGGGGAPGWMVTYGDLMSLLLTFFVLIVSFSSIQHVKFQKALGSLKAALGVLPKEESVIFQREVIVPQLADKNRKRIKRIARELQRIIDAKGLGNNIRLELTTKGILIRIASPVLFDLGEATIKPEAYPILDKVVEMTKVWPNKIRIEGHTDDLPIHTRQFPSNWELSTARALSVLRYFLSKGVEPQRLAAVGYGEYHPLVPNTSAENRAKNRRVEIYIERDEKQFQFREENF